MSKCVLKGQTLHLQSKAETVRVEWQQWFSTKSQTYTVCEYAMNGNPVTVYIQQGYHIPDDLTVDSRLQYG